VAALFPGPLPDNPRRIGADDRALPFASASFDAVVHSDIVATIADGLLVRHQYRADR
jgi:hypothetical protein